MDKLEKIVNYIILKAHNTCNLGLYHGKMGIVFALYLYARKHNDEAIKDFAWELLQDIYDNIHAMMPLGMENGYVGIGYAVTELYKLQMIECDLNDILSDLDRKIMEYDPRRITDFSFRNGAGGILAYINQRKSMPESLISLDELYLHELMCTINENKELEYKNDFFSDLKCPQWNTNEYIEKSLSADEGCSYFLISDYYGKVLHHK